MTERDRSPDPGGPYEELLDALRALVEGEPSALANLCNAAALLYDRLPRINWAGFYLWSPRDRQLVLGPFQGRPACVRLTPGRGVCGTAWRERRTVLVPDVDAFPGHVACDPRSRSEIAVPLLRLPDEDPLGVLDLDSPEPARFGPADAEGLERFVAVLLAHVDPRALVA